MRNSTVAAFDANATGKPRARRRPAEFRRGSVGCRRELQPPIPPRRVPAGLSLALTVCLATCTAWPAATASVAAFSPSGGDSLELSVTLLALLGSGAAVGEGAATSSPCGGASFCYLFVSSTPNADGTFGGVDVADSQCAADKPGTLPGTGADYRAILMSAGIGSTPARSLGTNWVLHPLMEYRRADGGPR